MKIVIQIPKELEKYVPTEANYFEDLVIPPLMQRYQAELREDVLKKEESKINNQLQEVRKKINIKREDKEKPVENGTFPETYTPPNEGKGEKEPVVEPEENSGKSKVTKPTMERPVT